MKIELPTPLSLSLPFQRLGGGGNLDNKDNFTEFGTIRLGGTYRWVAYVPFSLLSNPATHCFLFALQSKHKLKGKDGKPTNVMEGHVGGGTPTTIGAS